MLLFQVRISAFLNLNDEYFFFLNFSTESKTIHFFLVSRSVMNFFSETFKNTVEKLNFY